MPRLARLLPFVLLVCLPASEALAQGRPMMLKEPDGRIFADTGDMGAKHAGTGFVCPQSFNGVERRGLYIFDTSDHGRDVACGFGKPGSGAWFTLYISKYEVDDPKKIFERDVRDEQKVSPATGDVTPPLSIGLPPKPERAAFWKTSQGNVDGLWSVTIGSWHVRLLTTYKPDHESEVIGVARVVWAQVFDQVRGPEA